MTNTKYIPTNRELLSIGFKYDNQDDCYIIYSILINNTYYRFLIDKSYDDNLVLLYKDINDELELIFEDRLNSINELINIVNKEYTKDLFNNFENEKINS